MASLSLITNTFFVNLINRLGVRPPPAEGFLLSNVVQPISIVDADISIGSTPVTNLIDSLITGGVVALGAAGTLLNDSLAQNAGNYTVTIIMGMSGVQTANTSIDIVLARRNAANNADIWAQIVNVGLGTQLPPFQLRIVLAQGERLVARQGAIQVNGSVQVSFQLTPS
jgi:hypothetical protein